MTTAAVQISAGHVARRLAIAAGLIVCASVAGQLLLHLTGDVVHFRSLSEFFYVDEERNLPTAFSAFLLLTSALLLGLIAMLDATQRTGAFLYWAVLAFGFLAMAADEAWSFHERAIKPMRAVLDRDSFGMLYYAWVVPALGLVAVLGAFFAKFLWNLPRQVRRRFVTAAALYLGGAIGLELFAGSFNEANSLREIADDAGMLQLQYSAFATIEESLEMSGVIVFIWSLLSLLADRHRALELRFGH